MAETYLGDAGFFAKSMYLLLPLPCSVGNIFSLVTSFYLIYNGKSAEAFFDIDFFKNVNDTYGHNVGDKVLKLIARTLKANIRIEDVIGRWGGEEFIAVIRAVDENELTYVAEKMRVLVEKSSVKISGKDLSVTVSIGGTMYKKDETINWFDFQDDPEEIINKIEKLMEFQNINN